VIDDGLGIIRNLWEAGLAHRDIKPANLLVRDGHLLLIDVAFIELRPTPWRQAVDLANMLLCLALRASPERVYQQALGQFTVEEITEGFAAARGLALPSQLRRMLRAQGRDVHAEFLRLLPAPPRPIPIQRWTLRRVGLLAAVVLLLVLVFQQGLGGAAYNEPALTPTRVGNLACTELEPQWLLAQSVPSASLLPCLRPLPAGWMVGNVTVNNGRSVIPLNHDRAGTGVLVIRLTAHCDPQGATQITSNQPQVQRYQRINRLTPALKPPTSTCSRAAASPPRQPCRRPTGPRSPASCPQSWTTPPDRPSNRRWTSARAGDCDSTHPLPDQVDNPHGSLSTQLHPRPAARLVDRPSSV
jgi:hypothetical protein